MRMRRQIATHLEGNVCVNEFSAALQSVRMCFASDLCLWVFMLVSTQMFVTLICIATCLGLAEADSHSAH